MKGSFTGGLIGGLTSSTLAIIGDNILLFFTGIILAGILSGLDEKLIHRGLGAIIYYIVAFLGFMGHTILFRSTAILGVIILVVYTPIILVIYFGLGYITHRVKQKNNNI